jgi:multidrug efflux pump subunit AcrA (membrane-fusion protein)
MMCLSNAPARFFLLFGLGLTIGTTNAIAQVQPSLTSAITVENCNVSLVDSAELAAAVPGVLELVAPEIGDVVVEDEVIIGLLAEVQKAQKAIAQKEATNDVEIRYAKKAAELADAEYQKALEANRRLAGTVAQIEVDRLHLAAERAHLQAEQAQLTYEVAGLKADEAEANFQVYQIKAPISGTVVEKFKSRGEAVRQGDIILVVQSTARLHVEGLIGVKDWHRVKQGDKVKVQLNTPGVNRAEDQEALDGVVKFVDLTVEPVRQQVRVVAEVQNPDNLLRAGIPTEMTIFPGTAKEVQTTQVNRK